ncbi:ABC transporter ATP-binding protein [Antarctobacter heliothermus]|uniref:Putative ABC transport system ATP-binding protein n=1 Tax=Antarctobacter heliothermus TaxID=74033 RepID=A0A239AUK4_9RHOB|nr:ABC transporter ATP-binding protein [Antarctobacter heliothermus]SNR99297.1 putative ABC transport system ATP-binding protein [Antarctobacter heliothermus]
MDTSPLTELRHCHRTYDRGRIVALNDVSLKIGHGELVSITGPSGCGKSTLLDIMCGLEEPKPGEVFFDGHRIQGRSAWARLRAARIGFVFQTFHLIPSLSVAENIELAMLTQTRTQRARRARVAELLEVLGLGLRAAQFPLELSGGERQRVAIARALANRPGLVIADEPTGSLDSKSSAQIVDLLEGLQRQEGITVVIVTHDPNIAARCDRRINMCDGQIVSDLTTAPLRPEGATP